MKTEAEIDKLIAAGLNAELEGLDFVQSLDYATLCREYNGIGPEWADAELRGVATRYLALFEPAALIHDMRFAASSGTRFDFNFANMEFLENCLKLADHRYPFYHWRRYAARAAAHLLYDCVNSSGSWLAWQQAFDKNEERRKIK